jgi:hypothetical protein
VEGAVNPANAVVMHLSLHSKVTASQNYSLCDFTPSLFVFLWHLAISANTKKVIDESEEWLFNSHGGCNKTLFTRFK